MSQEDVESGQIETHEMDELLGGNESKHAEEKTKEELQLLALINSLQETRFNRQFDTSIYSVTPEYLQKLLFDSCENNLTENIVKILNFTPELDITMKHKKPDLYPLLMAARNGNSHIVDILLEHLNSFNDNKSKLTVALRQTNIFGNTIFHIIMKRMKMSISRGKYVKCMDVLMKYKEYFEDYVIVEQDHSLICDASKEGLEDFFKFLLKHGADPLICLKKKYNRNSLQLACFNGNYRIIQILIDHIKKYSYGDELLKKILNYKDEWGNTALHIIISGKDREIKENKKDKNAVKENIINESLDQNEANEPNIGKEDKYIKCMELLLLEKEFLDIDLVNNEFENKEGQKEGGNTALHKAAKLQGDKRFFQILIDNGAKRDIKNKKGDIAEVPDENNLASTTIAESESDIKEIKRNLQEALTNGNHLVVKELFETFCKKTKASHDEVNKFVDIIINGQICENTKKLSMGKKKERNGNINVDFIKCMEIVLIFIKNTFDNAQVIIDKILFSVCKKGILNFVQTLLNFEAKYVEPIDETYNSSSLQISFKKGYYLIAEKLVKYNDTIQLSDNDIKDIAKFVVDGFIKKVGCNGKGLQKREKDKEKKKKKNNISEENENEENYERCFELLLDPNLKFHNCKIKEEADIVYKICRTGSTRLADCLLNYNADPFIEFDNDKFAEPSPVLIASRNGYHEFVNLWLKKMRESKDEEEMKKCLQMTNKYGNISIHNVVRSFAMKDKNKKKEEELCDEIDYYKCLEILLRYKEYYNINAQDVQGNTALHYAIQLRDDNKFIKLLLMNGSQITIRNTRLITAQSKIPPSIIEEVLDECVMTRGDECADDFKISIDLSLFSHNHNSVFKSETDLLKAIGGYSYYRDLFRHPVINTFISMKWQKIRIFWCINLFLYMLFFSSLIAYVSLAELEPNYTAEVITLATIISVIGVYMLGLEVVQLLSFKLSYFKSFDNFLEISIFTMTIGLIYHPSYEYRAWIIVGSIIELILIFGKIPLFTMFIYFTMFKKVACVFFKIIMVLFLWLILAFSLSFYVLFNVKSDSDSSSPINDTSFATFSKSFLKTVVMSTGEMEYENMNLDSRFPLSSNLMFSLFIFVVIFITMNLMNGIAVSDIQIIQKQAESHAMMSKVECIIRIESTLCMLTKILYLNCLSRTWGKCLLFSDCFKGKRISVFPMRHYDYVWTSCDGHPCSLTNTKIYHCPHHFWLNFSFPSVLLTHMRFMEKCKECQIYYDKRVHVRNQNHNLSQSHINYHHCGNKYECGICKRWKYSMNKHVCLHRHRYFFEDRLIVDLLNIVAAKRKEATEEMLKQNKVLKEKQSRELQTAVKELHEIKPIVIELSEIIKKMQM